MPYFDSTNWNRHAILTCAEMRRAEELACAKGTASFDLMQRAGEAAAKIVIQKWQPCRALVLCGPGNNGGDGFVIAETLRAAGWDVTVTTLSRTAGEGDAARAAKNWQGKTISLENVSFDQTDLVIDALFGTGLTRALEGVARKAIEKLAASNIPVVAVDLPSGVNGDNGAIMGMAPEAALTVTFFRKKFGHLMLPGAALCAGTIVADIGIDDAVLDAIAPRAAENARDLWIDLFPFPKAESHKYTRGHLLIAGGAVMTGAARLAARAAQRIGAGLVTVAAPQAAVPLYSEALESAIVHPADTLAAWQTLLDDEKRNAVLIGPGLGLGAAQLEFVLAALAARKPCVLDADALTNFASCPERLFAALHSSCVLTPHEGEFARLFGEKISRHTDKLARARRAAEIAGCIVLLKGADTIIADPAGFAVINNNAPPWLAVAGAGDVLAGLIAGLLAQKMPAFTAAAAAAFIHGAAAQNFGPGLIAEDLVTGIPPVLKGLSESTPGV